MFKYDLQVTPINSEGIYKYKFKLVRVSYGNGNEMSPVILETTVELPQDNKAQEVCMIIAGILLKCRNRLHSTVQVKNDRANEIAAELNKLCKLFPKNLILEQIASKIKSRTSEEEAKLNNQTLEILTATKGKKALPEAADLFEPLIKKDTQREPKAPKTKNKGKRKTDKDSINSNNVCNRIANMEDIMEIAFEPLKDGNNDDNINLLIKESLSDYKKHMFISDDRILGEDSVVANDRYTNPDGDGCTVENSANGDNPPTIPDRIEGTDTTSVEFTKCKTRDKFLNRLMAVNALIQSHRDVSGNNEWLNWFFRDQGYLELLLLDPDGNNILHEIAKKENWNNYQGLIAGITSLVPKRTLNNYDASNSSEFFLDLLTQQNKDGVNALQVLDSKLSSANSFHLPQDTNRLLTFLEIFKNIRDKATNKKRNKILNNNFLALLEYYKIDPNLSSTILNFLIVGSIDAPVNAFITLIEQKGKESKNKGVEHVFLDSMCDIIGYSGLFPSSEDGINIKDYAFSPSKFDSLSNDLKIFYFILLFLLVKRIDRNSNLTRKIDFFGTTENRENEPCENEQREIRERLVELVKIDLGHNPLSSLIKLFNKMVESENLCHFEVIDKKARKNPVFSKEEVACLMAGKSPDKPNYTLSVATQKKQPKKGRKRRQKRRQKTI